MLRLRIIGYLLALVFVLMSNSKAEAIGFSNPTGPGYNYYSGGYGGSHEGIDITGFSKLKPYSIEDQPAFAAKDGRVIYADWQKYVIDPKTKELVPGIGRRGQIFYFDKWQIRADKGKVQNERFDPYLHDSYLQLSLKTKQNEGKNTENL